MVTSEDLAEVVSRERQLLDPLVRAVGESLAELLHPDFVEYGASGRIWNCAEIMTALQAEPGVSGEAVDFVPVALSENVVLLTYRIVGTPGSLRSSVWVKDSQPSWRIRFHQGTRSTTD